MDSKFPSVGQSGRRVPPNRRLRGEVKINDRVAAKTVQLPELNLNPTYNLERTELAIAVFNKMVELRVGKDFEGVERVIKQAVVSSKTAAPYDVLTCLTSAMMRTLRSMDEFNHLEDLNESEDMCETIAYCAKAHIVVLRCWEEAAMADLQTWKVGSVI